MSFADSRECASLIVSADVKLTRFVGVKVTHRREDQGLLAAIDADPGAGSGDQGAGPSGGGDQGDRAAPENPEWLIDQLGRAFSFYSLRKLGERSSISAADTLERLLQGRQSTATATWTGPPSAPVTSVVTLSP